MPCTCVGVLAFAVELVGPAVLVSLEVDLATTDVVICEIADGVADIEEIVDLAKLGFMAAEVIVLCPALTLSGIKLSRTSISDVEGSELNEYSLEDLKEFP